MQLKTDIHRARDVWADICDSESEGDPEPVLIDMGPGRQCYRNHHATTAATFDKGQKSVDLEGPHECHACYDIHESTTKAPATLGVARVQESSG